MFGPNRNVLIRDWKVLLSSSNLAILQFNFFIPKKEFDMSRIFVAIMLSALSIASVSAADSDPILARQELMENTRDAAKVIGGMLKEEQPFDAEAAMTALKTWKKTATTAGDLFPEGSETGHDTEAKATIWTDRTGFESRLANFDTQVDAAIAANPDSLEALDAAAGPVFKACKDCHEGYRVEKED
jgi:cytochrome c556